jgi:hypothetical protein
LIYIIICNDSVVYILVYNDPRPINIFEDPVREGEDLAPRVRVVYLVMYLVCYVYKWCTL